MNKTEEANDERHYIFMVVAIVVTLAGIYMRFVGNPDYYAHNADWFMYIGNITLVLGVILSLKAIYNILK
jgi:uncharacterized membrane protein HdeD (DUF308 family)